MRTTPSFNYRRPYFDGVGNKVVGKSTYEDALRQGDLDYDVEKRPVFTHLTEGNPDSLTLIPDKFATARTVASTDGAKEG